MKKYLILLFILFISKPSFGVNLIEILPIPDNSKYIHFEKKYIQSFNDKIPVVNDNITVVKGETELLPDFLLTGIFKTDKGFVAIINGNDCIEGMIIDNFLVEKIRVDSVVLAALKNNKKRLTLKIEN